jgi:hypothetical protein
VLDDLTAFCDRIRGRLEEASFADKQILSQLVVERIIVHESSLEIRHVIPLRSPPPGRDGPADEPDGRLRPDRVHAAPLPGDAQNPCRGGLDALVRIGNRQLHTIRRREAPDPIRAAGAGSKPAQGKPRRASLRRKAVQKLSASDG